MTAPAIMPSRPAARPVTGLSVAPEERVRHALQADRADDGRLAIQAATGLRTLPISPWAGLGVLAAWAAGALLLGGLLLKGRDA